MFSSKTAPDESAQGAAEKSREERAKRWNDLSTAMMTTAAGTIVWICGMSKSPPFVGLLGAWTLHQTITISAACVFMLGFVVRALDWSLPLWPKVFWVQTALFALTVTSLVFVAASKPDSLKAFVRIDNSNNTITITNNRSAPTEIGSTTSDVEALSRLAAIDAKLQSTNEAVSQLQGAVQASRKDIVQALGSISDSSGRLEGTAHSTDRTLSEMKSAIMPLDASITDLGTSLAGIRTALQTVNASVGEAKSAIEAVNASTREVRDAARPLSGSLGQLKDSVDAGNVVAAKERAAVDRIEELLRKP